MRICNMADCDRKHAALGLCIMHYKRQHKHGSPEIIKHSDTRQRYRNEYWIYQNIKRRCYSPTDKSYERYGGRGIKVSDEWMEKFENFLTDLGPRPTNRHSIDRINNDGNYERENCRWATYTEQNRNRRILPSNKSGVTGVCWEETRKTWRVSIKVDKKAKTIGRFRDFDKAIQARKDAELMYW